jgi:N-hydroxyarylamine O-acetyltransferase
VPFENLDIHLGRPIVLDEEALFAKIVARRRGGFCYELNGSFAALLRRTGFAVTLLSAAVAHDEGGFGPPFDHLSLLVETEERWLVDVGFGDSFVVPLHLDRTDEQVQGRDAYRIVVEGSMWTLLRRAGAPDVAWRPQYRFALQPHALDEFASMCHYHQTSPASSFTQGRVCSRATPEGRITLSEERLIVTAHGMRTEQAVAGERDYRVALRDHFGIVLDG